MWMDLWFRYPWRTDGTNGIYIYLPTINWYTIKSQPFIEFTNFPWMPWVWIFVYMWKEGLNLKNEPRFLQKRTIYTWLIHFGVGDTPAKFNGLTLKNESWKARYLFNFWDGWNMSGARCHNTGIYVWIFLQKMWETQEFKVGKHVKSLWLLIVWGGNYLSSRNWIHEWITLFWMLWWFKHLKMFEMTSPCRFKMSRFSCEFKVPPQCHPPPRNKPLIRPY